MDESGLVGKILDFVGSWIYETEFLNHSLYKCQVGFVEMVRKDRASTKGF